MTYNRIPPVSGTGAITSLPSVSQIPIHDPATTNYHQIPGTMGVNNLPPPLATAPSLSMSDLTQASGSYVIYDTIRATVTTPDATDLVVTTGVNIYETGVLVGAAVQGPAYTWILDIPNVTDGAKSYVATRVFAGGTKDSSPSAFTVLGTMAPDQVTSATLIAWFRVPESIQLGGTPEAVGTAPPAITLTTTGTLVRYEQIKITVVTIGVRGTATLNVFVDDMVTPRMAAVLTAATIAITGTDLTINCPLGTYSANNIWRSICNSFLDKVGAIPASANNFANGTAGTTRPYNLAAANSLLGAPCIIHDGIDDQLTCTGTVGTSMFAGADHVSYWGGVFAIPSNPAGTHTILCVSNITDTDFPLYSCGFTGTGLAFQTQRRSDTGSATATNSNVNPGTGQCVISDAFDGTNRKFSVNSADVVGGDSGVTANQGGKTITTTQAVFGCQHIQSGRSGFAPVEIYEVWFFSAEPSLVERTRLLAYAVS